MTTETQQWLKDQCNRYVNGQCSTRACLVRGGYKPGDKVDYNYATCEPHEIICEVTRLRTVLGDIAKAATDSATIARDALIT